MEWEITHELFHPPQSRERESIHAPVNQEPRVSQIPIFMNKLSLD